MVVDELTDDEVDRLFHALSDRTRRDLLRRAIDGERSISDLARHYAMSLTAVQKHVTVLVEAGLVVKQRTGREQRLGVDPAALARARTLLDTYERLWRARFDRIDALLASPDTSPRPGDPA